MVGIVGEVFPEVVQDEGVDIFPEPPETANGGIDIFQQMATMPVSEPVAQHRAEKYNYGLGARSPGVDSLKYDIQSGTETKTRQRIMQDQRVADTNFKLDIIKEMMANGVTDQDTITSIMNAEPDDLKDPASFFEKRFAAKMMTEVATLDYDVEQSELDGVTFSAFEEANEEDPETTNRVMDWAERVKTNQELDNKRLENLNARYEKEGILSTVSNYVEFATPFLSQYRISGLIKESKPSSWLLGNNMEEQYEYLNTLPVDERNRLADLRINELYESNPLDALAFAQGLVSFSGSDKFLNNSVTFIDASIVAPGGGLLPLRGSLAAGKKGATRVAEMAKGALKASSGPASTPAIVAGAVGEVKKAGLLTVLERLNTKATTSGRRASFTEFVSTVPSLFRPQDILMGIEKTDWVSRAYANRLEQTLTDNAEVLLRETADNPVVGGRLDANSIAQAAGLKETRDLINLNYGRGVDVVLDVAPVEPSDMIGNVNYAKVTIGNKDGTLFESMDQALNVNKTWYGYKGDLRAKLIGDKWALELKVPVDETSISVRNALVQETSMTPMKSIATMYLPYLRSADDLVSRRVAEESKSAVIGGANLAALAKQIAQPINKLSNKSYKDLDKFMAFERDFKPKGKERGVFSENIGEFSKNWQKQIGRLPTEAETTAYFTARQLNDIGWIGTNLGLYRDKARMGMELFHFGKNPTAKATIEGKRVRPDEVLKRVKGAGVLVIDPANEKQFTYLNTKFLSENNGMTRGQLQALLADSQYKVVQLSPTGNKGLRAELGEEATWGGQVNFVITKDVQSSPLPFTQIPYRPGGHVELDDGWFIRQPKIREQTFDNAKLHSYDGDINAYHFTSKEQANLILKNLEHARKLYLEGQTNKLKLLELKTFINKSNLPHTYSEFTKMFKGKNKYLDLRQPLYVTRKGESVEQAHKISQNYANWENSMDNEYNLYNQSINLKWAGERGDHMYTVMDTGSTVNPIYKYSPARHIQPLATLESSTASMMRGRYLEEYKHVAAEDFIARFSDVIDMDINDIRINPFQALVEGRFREGLKDKADVVKYAKANRRAVLEFLNIKPEANESFDFARSYMFKKIFGTTESGQQAALDFVDGWKLNAIKNTPQFLREYAFHTKLGLFNPMQYFLQAQTSMHVMGVAGFKNGFQGLEAAILHRAMMMGPAHKKAIAAKAFTGSKAADVEEAFDWAMKSGWYRVGREVAVRSDFIDSDMADNALRRGLDSATVFFKEGERLVRMTAWNAAFFEFKAANPGVKMTNEIARKILYRADLMSVNMTAASNASWQRGLTGIPTQFFAFQARLAEQFLGKRLTGAEKARLGLVYGSIYGLPVAAGAPLALWPINETFKEYMLEKGYATDENIGSQVLLEGIASTFLEGVTGTKFNVGERYGPGGLPILEDLINGDTTIMEAFGGVSGSTVFDTIATLDPLGNKLLSIVTPGAEPYPFTTEDMWSIVRSINTANGIHNAWTGMNLGQLISKNGNVTTEIDGFQGLMNLLFGLTPQSVSDTYRKLENMKELDQYHKEGIKEATKEFKRALRDDLSMEDRETHLKRGQHLLQTYNLPLRERQKVINNAVQGSTTVKSVGYEYAKQSREKMEAYTKEKAQQ